MQVSTVGSAEREGPGIVKLSNIGWVQVAPVEGVKDIPFGYPEGDIHRVGLPYVWRIWLSQAPNCIAC